MEALFQRFSIVFNNVFIFDKDSWYSVKGSESAVIPPPPQQCRVFPSAITVLIAMLVSIVASALI